MAENLAKRYQVHCDMRRQNYEILVEKILYYMESLESQVQCTSILYPIPYSLADDPQYKQSEAVGYCVQRLRDQNFYVRVVNPGTTLYISWDPHHVQKMILVNGKKNKTPLVTLPPPVPPSPPTLAAPKEQVKKKKTKTQHTIVYNPDCALSNVNLRAHLMKANPRYKHLKALENLK